MIICKHVLKHGKFSCAIAQDLLEDLRCREVLDDVERVPYVDFTLPVLIRVVLNFNTFGNPVLKCKKLLAESLPFIVLLVANGRHAVGELFNFSICSPLVDVQLVRNAALSVDSRFFF